MDRRDYLVALSGVTTTLLAGCGGDSEPTDSPTPSGEVVETITIETRSFEPAVVRIEVGEAVEWVNETGDERGIEPIDNISSETEVREWSWGDPPSGQTVTRHLMQPDGGSVTRTFNQPGIYVYADSQLTEFQACGAVLVGEDAEIDESNLPCAAFM